MGKVGIVSDVWVNISFRSTFSFGSSLDVGRRYPTAEGIAHIFIRMTRMKFVYEVVVGAHEILRFCKKVRLLWCVVSATMSH